MRIFCVNLCFVFLFISVIGVNAQEMNWSKEYKNIENLVESEKFNDAEKAAQKLLTMTEEKFGKAHRNSYMIRHLLGDIYMGKKQYKNAQDYYLSAAHLFENGVLIEDERAGRTYMALALLAGNSHDFTSADGYLDKAMRSVQKQERQNSAIITIIFAQKINLLKKYRKVPQTIPLYKKVIAHVQKYSGIRSAETARYINELGMTYYSLGRYKEAAEEFEKAVDIRTEFFSENSPRTAESINNLAAAYFALGDLMKVEKLYKKALKIRRETLGENHMDVAQTLNNLGALYYRQRRYHESEIHYRQALDIIDRIMGPGSPMSAQTMNNLSQAFQAQHKFTDAEVLAKKALDIRIAEKGLNDPLIAQSMNNLAGIIAVQNDFTRADSLYRKSLAIAEKVLGPNHPNTRIVMKNMYNFYKKFGKIEEAERLNNRLHKK